MTFVLGENLLPVLVALLIGFLTGMWIWRRARRADDAPRVLSDDGDMRRPYVDNRPKPAITVSPPVGSKPAGPRAEPEVLARRHAAGAFASAPIVTDHGHDDVGDNDVASGAAAAVEDIADQFLGIDAHPAPIATPGGAVAPTDDLQTMKGVGPKLASLLHGEGITRFEQIAALTPDDLARLDAHLGAFKGRLLRDRIVEQAAFLAAGDRAGYEREFGRL